jgi:hypothetical protein
MRRGCNVGQGNAPMSERDFEANVLSILDRHFVVCRRVIGTHFTGRRLILDAVAVPRQLHLWKNRNVALGIEFKDVMRLSGDTNNFTKWLAQCADYTNTDWHNYGYIYIFACPSLVENVPTGSSNEVGRILSAVMGQLGVGELREDAYHGWSFFLHGHHRLWSEREGVEEGRRYWLKRQFGNRA